MKKNKSTAPPCPCGSGLDYMACCRPRHNGSRPAETAEALMRSRFSAYALCLADYLLQSWHPDTRPAQLDGLQERKWMRLAIARCEAGDVEDVAGTVTFTAWYTVNGRAHSLRECSRFERYKGRWVYRDGEVATQAGGTPAAA